MKSYIVKLNETNEYFQVTFSPYNTIEELNFVKKKKDATPFQNEAHIHKNERGMELPLGKMRANEFNYFLHCRGIKKEDITVEEVDAPEEPLMTKKQKRELIFNKYGGRCAYCGNELQKGWHVDELEPVRRGWEYIKDENGRIWDAEKRDYKTKATVMHPERFNIDNQMPACASCNINKHSGSLEEFRKLIEGFMKHLNEINTQYKIAKRYGLVIEDVKPVVFYFERVGENFNKTN